MATNNIIPENIKVGDLVVIKDWRKHFYSLENSIYDKWPPAAYAVEMATAMGTVVKATGTGMATATVKNNKTNTEYNIKYWGEDWKLVSDNKIVAIVIHVTKEEHHDLDIVHLSCQDELTRYVRRMELEGCSDE
jgi:hypothetical protein